MSELHEQLFGNLGHGESVTFRMDLYNRRLEISRMHSSSLMNCFMASKIVSEKEFRIVKFDVIAKALSDLADDLRVRQVDTASKID